MHRILVTGGHGLLGSALVPYLTERGHAVRTCARRDADLLADLSDPRSAAAALTEASPDVIVNLAAYTDVDACERDPQLAYLGNARVVENLAGWVRDASDGTHLIQVSTDQIYDGPGVHAEENVTISNMYGMSKRAGELAAQVVPSTVLRTNFVGRSRTPSRSSFTDWLVTAMTRGDQITVFDDVQFSPLSIQSLIELLELAAVRRRCGVYNLGSRNGMSKADFAFALADALALPPAAMRRGSSAATRREARRPANMRMDSTRFESDFGVELPTLADEIRSISADYAREITHGS